MPHPYSSSLWVPLLSEGLWPSVCHLGCGMKVWARMLRGGQEKKAAKRQGTEEGRRRGGWETLNKWARRPCHERFPSNFVHHVAVGLTFSLGSWWAGPRQPGLPCLLQLSGPACSPAGVGTVTVAKCANLCHCPWARGSHGD